MCERLPKLTFRSTDIEIRLASLCALNGIRTVVSEGKLFSCFEHKTEKQLVRNTGLGENDAKYWDISFLFAVT